jgi:imidazolonepropionase-like amidohydrolase
MVKVGRKADLVLVKGDPTVDIESMQDVVGVWRNGVQLAK